ncbi:urease accessory protein UreF [Bradyrhizobium cosmicum]|uniref:Urease accessory protein UreF n=1 Tax=Bradyrhizobium cosmicum TaxID=1404864 RepID=A0AAI8MG46_9BRAD|nr:urease accessory UreF family protein [Bradyrhizobium cosmicum]BAL77751.1 urease accessory protein UreF [Bradyrhizobium cosmicum]
MLFDRSQTLALLQLGDSAYPAGGFAFSWGLEGLAADGMVANRSELDRIIADQLARRWASMDRILLRQAFRAEDCGAIAGVDRLAEAATASAEMREGSRRAGRALLGVWVKLDGALSVVYRGLVSSDGRLGHLAVMQAVVGRDAGLSLDATELVSGWTLVTGLVSAAVRLGIVGHIEAQRSQAAARGLLAELLAEAPPPDALPASFTPFIDIAVSRGPLRHVRMFTT